MTIRNIVLKNTNTGEYVKHVDPYEHTSWKDGTYCNIEYTCDINQAKKDIIDEVTLGNVTIGDMRWGVVCYDMDMIIATMVNDIFLRGIEVYNIPFVFVDKTTSEIRDDIFRLFKENMTPVDRWINFDYPDIVMANQEKHFNLVITENIPNHEGLLYDQLNIMGESGITFVLASDVDLVYAKMLLNPDDILIENFVYKERMNKVRKLKFSNTY